MDYEQKYKEANKKVAARFGFNVAKEIFSDLYESEDERIRKWLIKDIRTAIHDGIYNGESINEAEKALAWLEKQGDKDEEILILKDQIESLHAAITAIKETHRIELEKQGEQKPAEWSSRDDSYFEELTEASGLNELQIEWLTEIKDRVLQQPKQEWSEEDEKMFKETLALIETVEDINKAKDGFLDVKMWLKSLRPQKRIEGILTLTGCQNDSNIG